MKKVIGYLAFIISTLAFAAAGDKYFQNANQDKDIYIQVNDGGVKVDAIKVTGSTGEVTYTNPNLFSSGSVTAPSMAFSADNDGSGTGFYRIGANNLGFSANGVKVGEYSSAGAWSLGVSTGATGVSHALFSPAIPTATTAPTNSFSITPTTDQNGVSGDRQVLSFVQREIGATSGYRGVVLGAIKGATGRISNMGFWVSDTDNVDFSADERMRIEDTGHVGIGTSDPVNRLHVAGSSGDTATRITDSTANSTPQLFLENDAGTWIIRNDGSSSDNLLFRNDFGSPLSVGHITTGGAWSIGPAAGGVTHSVTGRLSATDTSTTADGVTITKSGVTGATNSSGINVTNSSTGTNWGDVSSGVQNQRGNKGVIATVTGNSGGTAEGFVGLFGTSNGTSTSTSSGGFGVVGLAETAGNQDNYGVYGDAVNSTGKAIGGYFRTRSSTSGSVGLVADNTTSTSNILEARDNGTSVFTVVDGGNVKSQTQTTRNVSFNDGTNTITKDLFAIDQDAVFIVEGTIGHHGGDLANGYAYKRWVVFCTSNSTGDCKISERESLSVGGPTTLTLAISGANVRFTADNDVFNSIGIVKVHALMDGTLLSF